MVSKATVKRQSQTESATVKRQDLHADTAVWTAAQYHHAVEEAQKLEDAAEGSPGFRRRHQLLTDIFHYEQHFDRPEYNRAQPAKQLDGK